MRSQTRRAALAPPRASAADAPPLPPTAPATRFVKVCGVTSPADAELAAAAGADLVGMILWPKAKRSVLYVAQARDIAAAARRHGAEPVGVFVDETAGEITRFCEAAKVDIAQLHGDGARAALPDLPPKIRVVFVAHADAAGAVQTPLPAPGGRPVEWLLVDSLKGGSGEAFDWENMAAPAAGASTRGWLLAGGLTPDNVAEAAAAARPAGVDVSSGVCGPDGLAKDPEKVRLFVERARAALGLPPKERPAPV